MFNRSDKTKKYVVLGRKTTVHNLDGDDSTKNIVEMYILKPNSTDGHGGWKEFERFYYKEIGKDGRGTDVGLEEGRSFITVDGSFGDFIDFNFSDSDLETHEIRFVKTYPNKNFMKRDRKTSFHEEYNVGLDKDGNVVVQNANAPAPTPPKATADFATIPAGTKYLYSRQVTPDGECIIVTDVNYWLKNDAVNDEMIDDMIDSLDNLVPNNWAELEEGVIEPLDGDFNALEKALQVDPEWNEDVNFTKFCS